MDLATSLPGNRIIRPQPFPGALESKDPPQPLPVTSPTSPQTLTAKQWVVPPRPKPGRKPAVDTPPTKRKAQNRAAQRAFRERKAAKVGELVGQVEEMEEKHASVIERLQEEMKELEERLEGRLRDGIGQYADEAARMEKHIQKLEQERSVLERNCRSFEAMYEDERKRREQADLKIAISEGKAVPLPKRRKVPQQQPVSDFEHSDFGVVDPETAAGCGRCTLNSRCPCIEEVIGMSLDRPKEPTGELVKRQQTPSVFPERDNKRPRTANNVERADPDHLAVDFTTTVHRPYPAPDAHSHPPPPPPHHHQEPSPSASGGAMQQQPSVWCGFCQDSSACPCAELVAERIAQMDPADETPGYSGNTESVTPATSYETPMPQPLVSRQAKPENEATPKDDVPEEDEEDEEDEEVPKNYVVSCVKEPGSCTQCQSDPSRTLFCKCLAAAQRSIYDPSPPQPVEVSPSNPSTATQAPCSLGAACCRVSSETYNTFSENASSSARQPAAAAAAAAPHPVVIAGRATISQPHFTGPPIPLQSPNSAASGETLSCAEVFNVLSHHRAFDRASRNLGEWLPRLATVPNVQRHQQGGTTSAAADGSSDKGSAKAGSSGLSDKSNNNNNPAGQRSAFEIEAASVMSVIKYFDRRFGRDD